MQAQTAIAALRHQSWVTFQGVLELFGANVFDARPALEAVFVWLHLAGAIGVVCALGLALARFFRSERAAGPGVRGGHRDQRGRYMFSLHAAGPARRPRDRRGAAAGRGPGRTDAGRPLLSLARRRPGKRWLRPAFAVLAAGYLGTLAYGAAQPPVPPANQPLAAWLAAHRLTDGLAGYWQANSTTLASRGQVDVSGVTRGPRRPAGAVPVGDRRRELQPGAARRDVRGGRAARLRCRACSPRRCGPSAARQRIYQLDGYTIMVWNDQPAAPSRPARGSPDALTCRGCGAWPPPAAPGRAQAAIGPR